MAKKAQIHYVDNKLLYSHMIDYIKDYKECKAEGKSSPRIPEYIGECILKIATRLSYKSNFILYTYKEDMIGDGIENCISYMHNFNPEKSNNPFAYFTMIIYNAFLHRIAKEHKQTYVKYKVFDNSDLMDELMDYMAVDSDHSKIKQNNKYASDHKERMGNFVRDYEVKMKNKVKTAKKKGVEVFVEEDKNENIIDNGSTLRG